MDYKIFVTICALCQIVTYICRMKTIKMRVDIPEDLNKILEAYRARHTIKSGEKITKQQAILKLIAENG